LLTSKKQQRVYQPSFRLHYPPYTPTVTPILSLTTVVVAGCQMLEHFSDSSLHTSYIIDTSTPETLERDFYAWLHASDDFSSSTSSGRCFADLSLSTPHPPNQDGATPIDPYEQHLQHHHYEIKAVPMEVSHGYSSPLPSIDLVVFGGGTNRNGFCPPQPVVQFVIEKTEDGYVTDDSPDTGGYLEGSLSSPSNSISYSSSTGSPSAIDDPSARSSALSGRNQLGRTYSPGLPLSMKEREYIVSLFQNGWKICDISRKLCVTHSCVSKILNRYRTTGSVKPKEAKEGRTESPLVAAIRDYRARLGMSRQSEIREQLIADGICTRDTAPSRSSINHILRTKLDLKKVKREKR
ncbi:hypothetical protein PENTCL1PPCAC_27308, partial [Pristionchus entomophagus]